MSDNLFAALFCVGAFLLIIIGFLTFSRWECATKWDSFETRWGVVKGCQLQVGGKWIPSESYYFKQEQEVDMSKGEWI